MTVIECCIDREGNTGYRDLKFRCPICKELYDTRQEALDCLEECVAEEHGYIEEVLLEQDQDDYIED